MDTPDSTNHDGSPRTITKWLRRGERCYHSRYQKQAAAQKAAAPYNRRLVQVLVTNPEPLLWRAEVIRRDGEAIGYVRAGSYGHTPGGAVGLAMIEAKEAVNPAYIEAGEWEIEIAGKLYPCNCSLKPMYDPSMQRIRN